MIRSTFCLVLFFLVGTFISCTKDILPNPATANSSLGNQAVIYDQTFNAAYPNWPSGWSASPSKGGWVMDTSTSNNSLATGLTTYTGASGGAMTEVSNPTSGANITCYMTSNAISTVGYTNISVIYGARNSSKFNSLGSSISSFQWSGDGGNTWNNIPFQDNPNDGNWYLINGGTRMILPGSAAGTTIIFRWTANLVATPSGTYRIDDFQVFGNAN